jgi:hypothetical protein
MAVARSSNTRTRWIRGYASDRIRTPVSKRAIEADQLLGVPLSECAGLIPSAAVEAMFVPACRRTIGPRRFFTADSIAQRRQSELAHQSVLPTE